MASLSSCWLLVESFIIPDGHIKWFYLSFYVHPFFLIFCQIFLWLRWPAYIIFFLPFKITCYIYPLTLIYCRCFAVIIRSYTRFKYTEVVYDVPEYENIPLMIIENDQNLILDSHTTARISTVAEIYTHSYEISVCKVSNWCLDEVDYDDDDECSEGMENVNINEEYSSSDEEEEEDRFPSCVSVPSPTNDQEMNLEYPSRSVCHLNMPLMEQELTIKRKDKKEEIDPFYEKYKEQMRWFDLLNHDRSFALSKILVKQPATILTDQRREKLDIQWAKMAKKRMLKSLENDIEMVYVSQTCLTWEALYYQHQKVESQMACSSATSTPISDGPFNYNSSFADEFQKFKILLERFMEDERLFDGHRYWNYVQKRSSHESLLQVPDISAGSDVEEEKQGWERAIEKKAIEKCIKTFLLFLQTEKKKKQWWKANSLVWTRPPLEDPRDLHLLHDLTHTLQKKELWLKDLKGKKRCWLKRGVNPLEVSLKKEMLFAMIEMKLVSRVLSMSIISTRQLNWCKEKLSNIEFKEGKIIRSCNIGPLFPSS